MIQNQTIDISFDGSLDMHSDAPNVQPPNYIKFENVETVAEGRIDKRPGIQSVSGTQYRNVRNTSFNPADLLPLISRTGNLPTGGTAYMYTRGEETLQGIDGKVVAVSEGSSRSKYIGRHHPYVLETGPLSSSAQNGNTYFDYGVARTAEYICTLYTDTNDIFLRVFDLEGRIVLDGLSVAQGVNQFYASIAGGDDYIAIAANEVSGQVVLRFYNLSGLDSNGMPAPTVYTYTAVGDTWDLEYVDDNASTSPFSLATYSGTQMTVRLFDSAGGLSATRTRNATVVPGWHNMAVSQHASWGVTVVYRSGTASLGSIRWDTTGSVVHANPAVAAVSGGTQRIACIVHTSAPSGGNPVAFVWSDWVSGTNRGMDTTTILLISGGGSSIYPVTYYNHQLWSRPVWVRGLPAVVLRYTPSGSGTYTACYGTYLVQFEFLGYAPSATDPTWLPTVLARLTIYGNADISVGPGWDICVKYFSYGEAVANPKLDVMQDTIYSEGTTDLHRASHYVMSLGAEDSNAGLSVNTHGYTYLSGAVPSVYDGNFLYECGYNHVPTIQSATLTAGGSLPTVALNWVAVYEYRDALGRWHRSPVSNPVTLTPGANRTASITVTPLIFSQRIIGTSALRVALYRTTQNNPTTYYFVQSIENSWSNISMTFTDSSADASIESKRTLYTSGGVLENDIWPSMGMMTVYAGRLWGIDTQNNKIVYSKTSTETDPYEISTINEVFVPGESGKLTLLRGVDQLLLAAKESSTYVTTGQPANDLGEQSNLADWQVVSSELGCVAPRAVAQTRDGVWFPTSDGIYLFSQGQLQPIGRNISPYAGSTYLAACSVVTSNRNQVMFSTQGGEILVYDVTHSTWGVWVLDTAALGMDYVASIVLPDGAAAPYFGLYGTSMVPRMATLNYSDTRDYAGGAYVSVTGRYRTGWLRLGPTQSLEARVRRVAMVFDSKYASNSSSDIVTKIYRNYSDTAVDTSTMTFTGASYAAGTSVPLRVGTATQRMSSVSIEVLLGPDTVANTQGLSLSAIGIEAGVYGGFTRLPAGNTKNV